MDKARQTVEFMVEVGYDFYNFENLYFFKYGERPTSEEVSYAEEIHYNQTSSYYDDDESYSY